MLKSICVSSRIPFLALFNIVILLILVYLLSFLSIKNLSNNTFNSLNFYIQVYAVLVAYSPIYLCLIYTIILTGILSPFAYLTVISLETT